MMWRLGWLRSSRRQHCFAPHNYRYSNHGGGPTPFGKLWADGTTNFHSSKIGERSVCPVFVVLVVVPGFLSGVASCWLVHPMVKACIFRSRVGGETISLLPPEPGRKEARAPRRPHRRRWRPFSPTPAPRSYWRLPVSRNRPCAPWSRYTARRFSYGRRVEVVGHVVSNQILWHGFSFFFCNGLYSLFFGQPFVLPSLYSRTPDRNSTNRPRNFGSSSARPPQLLCLPRKPSGPAATVDRNWSRQ